MFGSTKIMGIDVGFPDVVGTPVAPSPVPMPYPNIGTAKGEAKISGDFSKWCIAARDHKLVQVKASSELAKAVKSIVDTKTKVANAMDEVNDTLGRIGNLQEAQKKIMGDAAKLEAAVAKAFKTFDRVAKSSDKKAQEKAKAMLVGQGIALNSLFLTLDTLNKSLAKEQASLERVVQKLK